MRLIFFAINQHPTYKLIIAANRDEFYNRKTDAANFRAHFLESDHEHIDAIATAEVLDEAARFVVFGSTFEIFIVNL